jgi:hypothetical protein
MRYSYGLDGRYLISDTGRPERLWAHPASYAMPTVGDFSTAKAARA